mmetsp:Transcript_32737/g.79566  ORF Transcript_32737/g.79566 Transcript_32737/m.79566 type:complete len:88 (-) Transcript_32737:437-700(-)
MICILYIRRNTKSLFESNMKRHGEKNKKNSFLVHFRRPVIIASSRREWLLFSLFGFIFHETDFHTMRPLSTRDDIVETFLAGSFLTA